MSTSVLISVTSKATLDQMLGAIFQRLEGSLPCTELPSSKESGEENQTEKEDKGKEKEEAERKVNLRPSFHVRTLSYNLHRPAC